MDEKLEDFTPVLSELVGIGLVLRDVMDNLAGVFDDARKEINLTWEKI